MKTIIFFLHLYLYISLALGISIESGVKSYVCLIKQINRKSELFCCKLHNIEFITGWIKIVNIVCGRQYNLSYRRFVFICEMYVFAWKNKREEKKKKKKNTRQPPTVCNAQIHLVMCVKQTISGHSACNEHEKHKENGKN